MEIIDLENMAKLYRRGTALPAVTDPEIISGELVIVREGKERVCRCLAFGIDLNDDGLPQRDDIKSFVRLYDHCVKHKRLAYGQLSPITLMPLADTGGHPTAMLTVYAFSDYSIAELNEWLGEECFKEEGAFIKSGENWPNIERKYDDGGFRKRIWEMIFEGAGSANDELVEEVAHVVMDIIPGFYSGDSTHMDEAAAVENAASIAHIMWKMHHESRQP